MSQNEATGTTSLPFIQALKRTAWIKGKEVVPVASFWDTLIETPYFSDGYRVVAWLSAKPVSMFDIDVRSWDAPPRWMQR